jgi:hypothetical protein
LKDPEILIGFPLVDMFSTIIEVLKVVEKYDKGWKNIDQVSNLRACIARR